MNKKHLLVISSVLLICILIFTAYNSHMHFVRPQGVTAAPTSDNEEAMYLAAMGVSFETVIEIATVVVVAEFVARRPFEVNVIEYEFIVHDRIFGNTADTIFVYVVDGPLRHNFGHPAFQFTTDTLYLLPLLKHTSIYTNFHHDGFSFVEDLILDLNNPSRSTMYGVSLALHSNMNFDSSGLTMEEIISYIRSLPRNPYVVTSERVIIRSEVLEDIITGSPYVLVIEVNEPRRLADEVGGPSDRCTTDIFYVTVVEVLRGNIQVGQEMRIIFFADTVLPGETHLVSTAPNCACCPGSTLHRFTSRHSLHPLEYRDEIIRILRPRRPSIVDSTPTPSPSPTPTPSPSPTPTPSPTPQPSRFSAALYDPEAGANIQLTNIEVTLPEDFIADMHNRDNLNTTFLQDEMHRLNVRINGSNNNNTPTIITAYVGDLNLTPNKS